MGMYMQGLKEENFLLRAYENKLLSFFLQPVVDILTGELCYYELLMRILNKEDESFFSAGKYIVLAEKSGYMNIIDNYSIDQLHQFLQKTQNIKFGINISSNTIEDGKLIEQILREFDTKLAQRVIVEITETGTRLDDALMSEIIKDLQKVGFLVAIDDFGAGNTNLRQLEMSGANFVKIDSSIVKLLEKGDKNSINILKDVLKIAEKNNILIIAEGVENENIKNCLIREGVRLLQGYLINRPVSADFVLKKYKNNF